MSDPLVLRWAWRHHALEVDVHDTLEDAMAAAAVAHDDGTEALHEIEMVAGDLRTVVTIENVWAWRDANLPMLRPVPDLSLWAWVEIASLDDPTNFVMVEAIEAEEDAEGTLRWWTERLGAERVRVVTCD